MSLNKQSRQSICTHALRIGFSMFLATAFGGTQLLGFIATEHRSFDKVEMPVSQKPGKSFSPDVTTARTSKANVPNTTFNGMLANKSASGSLKIKAVPASFGRSIQINPSLEPTSQPGNSTECSDGTIVPTYCQEEEGNYYTSTHCPSGEVEETICPDNIPVPTYCPDEEVISTYCPDGDLLVTHCPEGTFHTRCRTIGYNNATHCPLSNEHMPTFCPDGVIASTLCQEEDPPLMVATLCPTGPTPTYCPHGIERASECPNDENLPTQCSEHRWAASYCTNDETVPTRCPENIVSTNCPHDEIMPTHCPNGEVASTNCPGYVVIPTHCPDDYVETQCPGRSYICE